MIVVTVGTHEAPFDRLVYAAERLAATGREVCLQRGYSTIPTPSCRAVDLMEPDVLDRWMAKAEVIVTHAGPASIRQAWRHGQVPIVVPRQTAYGEHVDDHQLAFARHLSDRIHLLEDAHQLERAVVKHMEVARGVDPTLMTFGDSRDSVHRFGVLIETVLQRPKRPRRSVRATLNTLMRIGRLR